MVGCLRHYIRWGISGRSGGFSAEGNDGRQRQRDANAFAEGDPFLEKQHRQRDCDQGVEAGHWGNYGGRSTGAVGEDQREITQMTCWNAGVSTATGTNPSRNAKVTSSVEA